MLQENTYEDGRLVIISNRLPVSVEGEDGGFRYQPSAGGLATSLNALRDRMELVWLGWPGISVDKDHERESIKDHLETEFGCLPLFLPQETFDRYYYGFSNRTIWPLFHYFPQHAQYEAEEWKAYKAINTLFKEKVLEIIEPGDRLWIQDYHLMLLPGMIREEVPEAIIGFFLHIPFPSYELFRELPWRDEILEGLLGADLVGFHSFGYARHFLSALLRIKALEHDFGRVFVGERMVRIDTFPLGVDVEKFSSASEIPEVRDKYSDLYAAAEGRKVVLSVDRLDFTKGILERLNAFETFLETHEEWQGKVTLIALCVPSRTGVPEYRQLKRRIDEAVGRINGQFGRPGWTPIWYLYRLLPFEELVPLYQLADVALVTPLRDGMNLVAKEYLASHSDATGVLILSETAGSAEELGEALIINPHDQKAIVEALEKALRMPEAEQKARNAPMIRRLRRYNTARWADDFLSQLEKTRKSRGDLTPHRIDPAGGWGGLLEAYSQAKARLLLLDYDGTLVPLVPNPAAAEPDDQLIKLIRVLESSKNTDVVVVSGRDAPILDRWLSETGVEMVAEHGARYKTEEAGRWRESLEGLDGEWKEEIRPVMEMFVDRTPGAILEDKGGSLVWHYRRAEPGLGSLRAKELTDALEGYLTNTPLQIMQGNKVIEVKNSNVSKGQAISRWLSADPGYDFIMAVGDDVTDEDMFNAVPEGQWTIKVGYAGRSNARFYVTGPAEVRELLKDLSKAASQGS